MAGVPQATLNWLYDVLKREYRDPNRTYSDVAQTLSQYPGLAPRTEVYTSESGAPALLLNLKGILPVNFRGTVYQFPIALWIPHAYPREAPIAYVTPTGDMVVRPGQHVSASDGKIYHQYLARWRDAWERSNIVELVTVLSDIFSREPPVMAKIQQTPPRPPYQQHQGGPPPIPPSPQDPRRYSSQPPLPAIPGRTGSPSQNGPPRPPPKQTADMPRLGSTGPPHPAPKPGRYDAPPPLPQSIQPQRSGPSQSYGNGLAQSPLPPAQYMPQRTSSLRQEFHGREQPPIPQLYRPQSPARPPQGQGNPAIQSPNYQQRYSTPPPLTPQGPDQNVQQPVRPTPQSNGPPQPYQQQPYQQQFPQGSQPYMQPPQLQQQQPQQQQTRPYTHPNPQSQQLPSQLQQPPHSQPTPPPSKPAAPKDLLSDDDPFQISLTSRPRSDIPAPPIPTNPEKTALLSHLSHLTLQHLHTLINQTQTTALPSLHSQHSALLTASSTLTTELAHLQSLHAQLQSNISALQTTLSSANTTIAHTQDPAHASHADNIPPIDQIIIPPSVVARQLYDTVAEQRGYEAAIFALNEAFVRGRVGSEVWGRKVREYAREEMRRKWLVRKIGEGLGLEEG